ncbi:MAG: EAL domain-containing protein [Syntrophaceae bacterium]|nr:EAL domain-containing protein [Syntrophaceae bacterium]
MTNCSSAPLSLSELKEIIAAEGIIVHFQQILSTRNHSVIGCEGLIRGLSPDGRILPPLSLFDAARRHGLTLEFDRLCREKVLASFRKLLDYKKNYLLFLNLETSFLSSETVGSGYFLNQVIRNGIPPANIVIEFVESRTADTGALLWFVKAYGECGFNIALDDVGAGHSNFDRISLLRPNIIKVDRSIISGVAADYFKQEIFRSLANLSQSIGSLILAEGVETREEAIRCLEYGADLFQGYYFARPRDRTILVPDEAEQKLTDVANDYKIKCIDMVKARRLQNKLYQKAARSVIRRLEGKPPAAFEGELREAMSQFDFIDALYVVDDGGIQQTDTVMKGSINRNVNPLFQAARKHEDLSYKEYYFQLINTDLKRYTTDHYISFATGNLCITLSHLFQGSNGHRYILCMDFLADDRSI